MGIDTSALRQKEILQFISRRWTKDSDWTTGNCYYFALILCSRFPELSIYYAGIEGHFVAGKDNVYYDWTGIWKGEEDPILFSELEDWDPFWYNRIVEDCIM